MEFLGLLFVGWVVGKYVEKKVKEKDMGFIKSGLVKIVKWVIRKLEYCIERIEGEENGEMD